MEKTREVQRFDLVPITPRIVSDPVSISQLYSSHREIIPSRFVGLCLSEEDGTSMYELCVQCAQKVAAITIYATYICSVRTTTELQNLADNGLIFNLEFYWEDGKIDLWAAESIGKK